ncbi:MAG: M48 family metallopeptidase [Gammaproteobacteria bacterium]|nr:M48 family metallopeptidase [Gammaproteobacteria bacterium]
MQLNVDYGKRQFIVEIKESAGKNLSITVYPDLRVVAKVPKGQDKQVVEQRLQKRATWISKQLDYFSAFHPLVTERKYVSGETHYYLGRQYRLRITRATRPEVKLKGGFFMVGLPEPDNGMLAKKHMQIWYARHAAIILHKYIAQYMSRFIRLGAKEPTVKIRMMEKRWASCNNDGVIVFNLDLIKAPVYCVEYVVVHELCHLICDRHNAYFYRLLEKMAPNWKKCKERLEASVI